MATRFEDATPEQLRQLLAQIGGDLLQERVDERLQEVGGGLKSPRKKSRGVQKTEAQIRREIRTWYELQGAWVGDYEQGYRPDACPGCGAHLSHSTRVPVGTPDLLVLWPGRGQRWIECKSATGKQTDAQREFEARVRAAGGIYWVVRSVEEVTQLEVEARRSIAG